AYGMYDLFEMRRVDFVEELGKVADWRRQFPQSIFPNLVEGMIYRDWAWGARGTGSTYSVSPQAFAVYGYRIEAASAAVAEIQNRAASAPLWYELSLRLGGDKGIGLDALRQIYKDANQNFPELYVIDRQMLRALMPRWYGSYENVAQFIGERSTVG